MHTFDLHIEQALGVHIDPDQLGNALAQHLGVEPLEGPPGTAEGGVLSERDQAGELLQIGDPGRAYGLGDKAGKGRVGLIKPPPLGHPIGDVDDLLRPQGVKVREQVALEQVGMKLRYAVDRMSAHQGQIGHADALAVAFLENGQASHPFPVPWPAGHDLIQKAAVDFADDLDVAWQQTLE